MTASNIFKNLFSLLLLGWSLVFAGVGMLLAALAAMVLG